MKDLATRLREDRHEPEAADAVEERDRLREINAELLEALKRCIRDKHNSMFWPEAVKQARAAIAKAEGTDR